MELNSKDEKTGIKQDILRFVKTFFVSLVIALIVPLIIWRLGLVGRPDDFRYIVDFFFLSGVLCFIVGMIILLTATSRRPYYKHLREKFRGNVTDDSEFEQAQVKRKKQMYFGIAITISGMLIFALSGYLATSYGF